MYVYVDADNNTNKLSVHAINGIGRNLGALVIKERAIKYSSAIIFNAIGYLACNSVHLNILGLIAIGSVQVYSSFFRDL